MLWQWVRNLLQQLPHSTSHNILQRDMSLPTYQHMPSCPSLPCTFSKHVHPFLTCFRFVNTSNKLGTNICLSVFLYFSLIHYIFLCLASRKETKSHLKVDELQVSYQSAEQATVVEFLGELGHCFCLGLFLISPIQDLFHGHQAFWHLFCSLNTIHIQTYKYHKADVKAAQLIKLLICLPVTFERWWIPKENFNTIDLPSQPFCQKCHASQAPSCCP